jgi:hypothetical protein
MADAISGQLGVRVVIGYPACDDSVMGLFAAFGNRQSYDFLHFDVNLSGASDFADRVTG